MNMSTSKVMSPSRRKVAILLMYLDSKMPGLSQQLFSKMGESQSKVLLHEIKHLGKVEKNEIDSVVKEFYELAIDQNSIIGGKNVTGKLLKDSFGIEDADDFFSSKKGLFDFINHLPDKTLVDYLKKENLQVASLILSLISDERSAKLLSDFPLEKTAIISKKMLSLSVPSYPLLWKFHHELEVNLLGEEGEEIEESQQIFKLSRVLEMMVSDTRKTVVDMISTEDKSSADKIQQLIFSFNDLVYMSNKDLGILLVEIDPLSSLAIAMQGISEELKDKILSSVSERLKSRLDEEIENENGALEDAIQKTQGNIVQLCRRLEKEEKIEPLINIMKQKNESSFVEQTEEKIQNNDEFPLEDKMEVSQEKEETGSVLKPENNNDGVAKGEKKETSSGKEELRSSEEETNNKGDSNE